MPRLISEFYSRPQYHPHSLLLAFALILTSGGCGTKTDIPKFHADLVPATGTVTYQNKPVTGAAVMFTPIGDNAVSAAYGMTDDQGHYELITPVHGVAASESKGAVPGEYKVIISKMLMPDGTAVPSGVTEADAIEKGAKESLPPKYSRLEVSILKELVEKNATPQEFNFELK